MKLNHAQRAHLIAKLTAAVEERIKNIMASEGLLFTVTIPCAVDVTASTWRSESVSLDATVPDDWEKHLSPIQKELLEASREMNRIYGSRQATKTQIINEFTEALLFADGGLEEANGMIAAFLEKMQG